MYNIINALAKYMITCFKHSLFIVKGSYFTVTVFIRFNCFCLLGAKRLPKGLSTELVNFAWVPNFMCWLVASKVYVMEVAESQVTAVVVEFPTDWSGSGVCLVTPRLVLGKASMQHVPLLCNLRTGFLPSLTRSMLSTEMCLLQPRISLDL